MHWPEDEPKSTSPPWFITFADLMGILLGFFVLLFALSSLEASRFQALAGSVRQAFGASVGAPARGVNRAPAVKRSSRPDKVALYEQARQWISTQALDSQVEAHLDSAGVRLQFAGAALFDADATELRPEAFDLVDRVAQLALQSGGAIAVEGHTDSAKPAELRYPSNWELAGARAGAVVRRLSALGVPAQRLEAVAYGDARPRASNDTGEGRQVNRRVEILIRTER